jgi:hypothetical protein
MSVNSAANAAARTSTAKHFKLHVTLEGPDNYEQWKKAFQGQLFTLIRNNNMDTLTTASTLDDEYSDHGQIGNYPVFLEEFLKKF